MRYLTFVTMLAFLSCGTENQVILEGFIGKELKSEFRLHFTEEYVSGDFLYLEISDLAPLKVKGFYSDGELRLLEYAAEDTNTITGIFEGAYDGNTYEGYWRSPAAKKKTPFKYSNKNSIQTVLTDEKIVDSGIAIQFEFFDQAFGDTFHNGLIAEANGKRETIIRPENDHFNGGSSYSCFTLVGMYDLNGNGIKEGLFAYSHTCGGNAYPWMSGFIVGYDKVSEGFFITESFGDFLDFPVVESWEGQITMFSTSVALYSMGRADTRHALIGKKVVEVYSKVYPKVEANVEIDAENINLDEDKETSLFVDLNSDGIMEEIVVSPWFRWRSLIVRIMSGDEHLLNTSCHRIGVLDTKTKGYFDLVCGLDYIYVWNGNKYVPKTSN